MQRFRAIGITLAIVLGSVLAIPAQQAEPRAMTKEELLKELHGQPPIRGELLIGEKRLCSLDSAKASGVSVSMSASKPSTWARLGPKPSLALTMAADADLKRIVLVKDDAPESPQQIALVRSPGKLLRYELRFEKPLPPGDYEFAITSGKVLLFPQCGFTVTNSPP